MKLTIEKYNLKDDIKVFGVEVKNFPEGIGEAFDKLVNMLAEGLERSFYGISEIMRKSLYIKRLPKKNIKVKQKSITVNRMESKKGNT
ncbi:MAG: hypothetical protein ABJA79_00940 [Parafilimonas sp.]